MTRLGTIKEHAMPSSLNKFETALGGRYAAPTLATYGDAKKLTASGTGTVQENTQTGGCQSNTTRRPC